MNTRAKGNAFQVWIRRFLVERGWIVRNFPLTIVPITVKSKKIFRPLKQDAFGADLICRKIAMNMMEPYVLWIQASCSGGIKKRVEEFQQYFKFLLPGERLQIWIKTPKGINISEVDLELGLAIPLGKIIRGKWYAAEGVKWEFGEEIKP